MDEALINIKAEWVLLRSEIGRRFYPVLRPSGFFYFLVVIVLVGGAGAWIQLYRADYASFFEGLGTYALAILTAASVEIVFPEKTLHSLRMLGLAGLALGGALATIAVISAKSLWSTQSYYAAAVPASILTVIALFLWILGNSDNVRLFSESPESAIGGPPSGGLPGDLDDFQR